MTTYCRLRGEMDFAQLAMQSATTVPGFRKGDIVREYSRLYG